MMEQTIVSLSQNFWPDFILNHWEQRPTVLPNHNSFISLTELFDTVTRAQEVKGSRFWVATQNPPKSRRALKNIPFTLFGPKPHDRNFETYFHRVRHHVTGTNVHHLAQVMPALHERTAQYRHQLSAAPQHPQVDKWILDTFFGTYAVSPLGIHKDCASVFTFILMGKRTYCTWPSDYFDKQDDVLRTLDLEKITPHLKYAEVATVKAGEAYYWPSNRWHIILSDGEPSVVAQISAYFKTSDLAHW